MLLMQYEIYRVQIEDLCEGGISLCEAEKNLKFYWKKGIFVVLYV